MTSESTNAIAKEIGVAALMLVILIPFYIAIGDIYVDPSDPGFGSRDFPKLIVYLGMVLSLFILIKAGIKSLKERHVALDLSIFIVSGDVVKLFILTALYIWGITAFQYLLSTLCFLIVMMYYFGNKGSKLIIIPIFAVLIYYFVFFVLFGVYDEPGTIISYDSYSFSQYVRKVLLLNE